MKLKVSCCENDKLRPDFLLLIIGVHSQGRMLFPMDMNADLVHRTNETYQLHLEQSLRGVKAVMGIMGASVMNNVIRIPEDVCIDYMHAVLLGVVRNLLCSFIASNYCTKAFLQKVSSELEQVSTPHSFKRRPRSLTELKYWKAHEIKHFLIYYGPLVLRDAPLEILSHFLLLSASIRLLLSDDTSMECLDIASSLIRFFSQDFPLLYGDLCQTHNLHSLLHLVDQVNPNIFAIPV